MLRHAGERALRLLRGGLALRLRFAAVLGRGFGRGSFRGVVGLGAAIVFFVVAAKVKWAVGTTLLTGIMAAAVIFFVAGGLEWVSGMLGNTVQTAK